MPKRSELLSTAQQLALQDIAKSAAPYVIGVDEVGIGAWAGPVVVAAFLAFKGWEHELAVDSKSLTPNQRKKAVEVLKEETMGFCILAGTNEEIDTQGIRGVQAHLTFETVSACLRMCDGKALVIQDGDLPVSSMRGIKEAVWLPKADVLVPVVGAASILAKVHRDDFMKEMARYYPGYGFETNVGYCSKKHLNGLAARGVCRLHRRSYRPIKRFLNGGKS